MKQRTVGLIVGYLTQLKASAWRKGTPIEVTEELAVCGVSGAIYGTTYGAIYGASVHPLRQRTSWLIAGCLEQPMAQRMEYSLKGPML